MHQNPKIWLEVEGDFLRLIEDEDIVWQVPITDLVLIAEFTTDTGPWAEDYYDVFGAGHPPQFYQISLWMAGGVLPILSTRLDHKLAPGLIQSTEWRSRIMWPPALDGQELFVRSVKPRPRGVFNRLKDALAPMRHVELQSAVTEYLAMQAPRVDHP
jgi:hypothetical protein